jgi:hypothetical protein
MPFHHEFRPYTKAEIEGLNPNQNGVYGLFRGNMAMYIGSGDIRTRLLAHLNGDNPCIIQEKPNQWTGETFCGGITRREGELIQEYRPICNRVTPH